MRGILLFRNQVRAVQTGRRGHALGKVTCGREDEPAAHAVPDRPDGAAFGLGFAVQEIQQMACVIHHHRPGQFSTRLENLALPVLIQQVKRNHPVFGIAEFVSDPTLPVIKIGHDTVVPLGGDAAGYVVELLAYPPDVHIDHDRGKRLAVLGMGDERLHDAVGGGDRGQSFFHGFPIPPLRFCAPIPVEHSAAPANSRPGPKPRFGAVYLNLRIACPGRL